MKNVLDGFVEKTKEQIFRAIFPPPPPENRAFYEIMWKNRTEPDRLQFTK
jgi:hypothetical protein